MTWNALSHPNVLPFLGVTMEEDQLAMISEWMVNGNINEFLRVNWEANPFKLVRPYFYHLPLPLLITPPDSSGRSLMG